MTKQLSQLGTIRLQICRVSVLGEARRYNGTLTAPMGLNEIPEKALKGRAISHTLRYVQMSKHTEHNT